MKHFVCSKLIGAEFKRKKKKKMKKRKILDVNYKNMYGGVK
jgi:hypothetical protein